MPDRALRAWAWVAGGLALLSPLAAIAQQPKPDATPTHARRQVIVRTELRRVVVVSPRTGSSQPRVVYVDNGGVSGGTAAPAATTTGGSAPA
jgi:hypothetical protein